MAASSSQRTIFLLTCSQADLEKFPTRQSFADVVFECFAARNIRISMWVASLERHKNGGFHYHMPVKLFGKSRWLRVRREIFSRYAINVNFNDDEEDSGNTYFTAYKYVVRSDSDFLTSLDHPEMTALPRTDKAIAANRQRAKKDDQSRKRKREERMSDHDLLKIIQERKFTSRLQVLSLAAQLQAQGKVALTRFIASRGSKCIENALLLAKELKDAPVQLERQSKSRLQLLRDVLEGPCVEGCGEQWMKCAVEAVRQNGIEISAFATAVYELLRYGRGKFRNIFVHGPANCGKSFLLHPLKLVYKTFLNPAHGTFAWVGRR